MKKLCRMLCLLLCCLLAVSPLIGGTALGGKTIFQPPVSTSLFGELDFIFLDAPNPRFSNPTFSFSVSNPAVIDLEIIEIPKNASLAEFRSMLIEKGLASSDWTENQWYNNVDCHVHLWGDSIQKWAVIKPVGRGTATLQITESHSPNSNNGDIYISTYTFNVYGGSFNISLPEPDEENGALRFFTTVSEMDVLLRMGETVQSFDKGYGFNLPAIGSNGGFEKMVMRSVKSSDPSVINASVEQYTGSYLSYYDSEKNNSVIDNLGLKLEALKPGEATVTMEVGFPRDGKQSAWYTTYTINVKVNGPLEVDMKVVDSNGRMVDSIEIATSNAYEQLPDELRHPFLAGMADFLGSLLPKSTAAGDAAAYQQNQLISGGLTAAGAAVVNQNTSGMDDRAVAGLLTDKYRNYVDPDTLWAQDSAVMTAHKETLKTQNGIRFGKALSNVGAFTSNIKNFGFAAGSWLAKLGGTAAAFLHASANTSLSGVKRVATIIPYYDPNELMVELTLTNNSDSAMVVNSLSLQADQYTSFSSLGGPWGNLYNNTSGILVPPRDSKKVLIPIYARIVYGDLADNRQSFEENDKGRYAYDAVIEADCLYTHPDFPDTVLNTEKDVSIAAYSKITAEDVRRYLNSMGYNMEYFRNHFGVTNLEQLLFVACPVDVVVSDADGNEITTLKSGEETVYEAEGLTAAVIAEQKIVIIAQDMVDEYRVEICPVGEGSMDVMTVGADENGKTDARVYDDVPVAVGETYNLSLSHDESARLHMVNADQTMTELTPLLSFTHDDIAAALRQTDISEWAIDLVASAIQDGLVCDISEFGFRDPMTQAEFAEMLSALYSLHFNTSGIAIPVDEAEAAQTVSAKEAAEDILEFIQSTLLNADAQQILDLREGKKLSSVTGAQALSSLKALGIMTHESENPDVMTREEGIAAIFEAWEYVRYMVYRNAAITSAVDGIYEFYSNMSTENLYRYYHHSSPDKGLESFRLTLHDQSPFALCKDYGKNVEKYLDTASKEDFSSEYFNPLSRRPVKQSMILIEETAATVPILYDEYVFELIVGYYPDGEGDIMDDMLYLVMLNNSASYDWVFAQDENTDECQYEFWIINDDEIISQYLAAISRSFEQSAAKYRELAKGDRSNESKTLQKKLITLGYLDGTADGIYGNMTVKAVSAFQQAVGLEVTGVADSATQEALFAIDNPRDLLLGWMERHSDK